MNQPIFEGVLPILSSVLGNNTVAGVMAIFSLALDTITTSTAAFNKQASSFKNQDFTGYAGQQAFYGQGPQPGQEGNQFQSQIMSTLAMIFSTLNSGFTSLTASETPLTTYIIVALLSYVAFLIVYGIVSWIVRSVLNLIKLSIIISIVTVVLWFIINITSSPEGTESGSTGQQQYRHQDPISKFLYSAQTKFRTEYERQQQNLQNPYYH
ncbi:hypothetical protein BGX21_006377 [Mortierella sp. AD011]|nr:hypothetical protein BGX20_000013 [Mortierella sp. AD010]KAF9403194.1 hypothetical protein BGX21_006377 [Mortierella sp. AD011]